MRMQIMLRLLAIVILVAGHVHAADRPVVALPRQTGGDTVVQPTWEETLIVTVGTRDADIVGDDHRAIQAAVDHVARLGGGTVHVKAGTYRLRNSICLQSGVSLVGDGPDTILLKEPSMTTPLRLDSDWYDQEITLTDPSGFRVGDGVCLRSKNTTTGRETVLKRTLTARSGDRYKLDKPLRENLWQMDGATCSTLFPLLGGDSVQDLRIEKLTLDGNHARDTGSDAIFEGCICLQECNRIHIRAATVRNYNGDGISWQMSHDVVVEDCVVENHKDMALHPGSGSQRPIIRNNVLRGSHVGLFFCWGVKYGLAEGNQVVGNRVGISIGHRDTDNLVFGNTIRDNAVNGLLFRDERGPGFTGDRNRIEGNTFVNNAANEGAVVAVEGTTHDIRFRDNRFSENRPGVTTRSVVCGPETKGITVEESRLEGSVGPAAGVAR